MFFIGLIAESREIPGYKLSKYPREHAYANKTDDTMESRSLASFPITIVRFFGSGSDPFRILLMESEDELKNWLRTELQVGPFGLDSIIPVTAEV